MVTTIRRPNPNLWSVEWKSTVAGLLYDQGALFVLGASASHAERKARAHLKRLGKKGVTVGGINHEGEIDVF